MKKKKIPIGIRRVVMLRDNYKCQVCGKRAVWFLSNGIGIINIYMKKPSFIHPRKWEWYDPEPFEIDHIYPENSGGKTTLINLRLLCRGCNRSKGIKIFNTSEVFHQVV